MSRELCSQRQEFGSQFTVVGREEAIALIQMNVAGNHRLGNISTSSHWQATVHLYLKHVGQFSRRIVAMPDNSAEMIDLNFMGRISTS